MTNPYLYPLDLTGKAPSNRVSGERQALKPPQGAFDFHFIIPRSGPFYRDSVVLRHLDTNRILIRGSDWQPGHWFKSASYETENVEGGIYQSILFMDKNLSGNIEITSYQVLGDKWSLDESKILEILSVKATDPRQVLFEQVNGMPEVFPPIGHQHPADDMIGQRELVEATYQVSDAIREQTLQLPPQLRLALENYYNRSEVDQLLVDLSQSLINGVMGPELEQMLESVLAQMIANYYTKSQIDQMLNDISTRINQMYTNVQINNMLAAKLDKSVYDQEIAKRVTHDEMSAAISSIVAGSISSDDLDAVRIALEAKDSEQQVEIEALRQTMAGLGGGLEDYVKLEDLDELIPKISFPSEIFRPASILSDDGPMFKVNTVSVVMDSGKIRRGEFMVAAGCSVTIVAQIESGGIPETYEVPATLVEYDATDGWEDSGYTSANDMWDAIKDDLVGFSIRLTVNDYVDDNNGQVEEFNFECNNTFVFEHMRDEDDNYTISYKSLSPTTSNNLLVAAVTPNGASATVFPFYNEYLKERMDVRRIELTLAQAMTTTPVSLDFPHYYGHDYISTVKGVKLLDPNGVLMGVAGYFHEDIRCYRNRVTIFKPSIDLAAFGAGGKITIEVTVHTRSL